MSGSRSRDKGARGEREVVDLLRDNGYPQARRYLSGDGRQPGDVGPGPTGWVIEVKWHTDPAEGMRRGLAQVEWERTQAGAAHGVVAVRLPRKRWVAVLDAVHADAIWHARPAYVRGTIAERLEVAAAGRGPLDIGDGRVALPFVDWIEAAS